MIFLQKKLKKLKIKTIKEGEKKMKDILTVMKFTIKDMVRRKSFIISTLIILVLIVIGFNVPNIIKSIKGEKSESNKKVY